MLFVLVIEILHASAIGSHCDFTIKFSTGLFSGAKASFYTLLTFRLYVAYYGSAFAYNNIFFICLASMLAMYAIASFFIVHVYSSGEKVYVKDANGNTDKYYWCSIKTQDLVFLIYGTLDVVINILLTVLFIKPLRKVISFRYAAVGVHTGNCKAGNYQKQSIQLNVKLENLARKYTIITVVACFTSIIFFGMVGITDWAGTFVVDWAINSVCVASMSHEYQTLYEKLCACCITCSDICDKCTIGRGVGGVESRMDNIMVENTERIR